MSATYKIYQENLGGITPHESFAVHFRNGWCASVTWGNGTDSSEGSAEVVYFPSDPELSYFGLFTGGRTTEGYCSPETVADFLMRVARLASPQVIRQPRGIRLARHHWRIDHA